MYTKHAEFKAGVIVLLALAGLGVLVWFAAGAESFFDEWREVHVRFKPGVIAPKVGDDVYVLGKDVGTVESVTIEEEIRGVGGTKPLTPLDRNKLGLADGEDGTFRELYILCRVKLPSDQVIPAGTTAQISETLTNLRKFHLFLGSATDNLADDAIRATPIPGRAVAGLSDLSNKIDQVVDQISTVIGQGGEVMTEAKELIVLLQEKIDAFNTVEMDRDVRAALGSVRRTLEEIEGRIATIGGNFEDASADIKKLASQAVATLERLDGDIAEAMVSFKSALANLDGIIKEARGPVREILGDIKTAARNAADVTGEFAGIGPEVKRMIEGLGVDIDTLLRNLIDTSRNLQDTSEDVRAHPWKLLNKPDEEEIAFENLRAAALSYMRAMRDLNDASRRLVALMGRDDLDDPEAKRLLETALREFEAAQERYQRDEARWQQLFSETNPVRRGPAKGRKGR